MEKSAVLGGLIGGLAFGPLLSLLCLIFIDVELGVLHIFISILGFSAGFVFGYKRPSEVIFRAVTAVLIVVVVYVFKRLM